MIEEKYIQKILKLHRIANERDWKPWILQSELKKVCEEVISVGDDLSFTLRFDKKLVVDEKLLTKMGAKKTRLYPFRNAYRFERGFIAVEGKFVRISRNLDAEKLKWILERAIDCKQE
ncbi:hypothetical protein Asulf_01609 [Archaeoglobus sulfaticallidus PM70-1]|uniref:Uncharacterized protein n=1 Tax=Archaeoglobus sulfaticallidus PM70-1 TaxID=387631 RepID=N0BMU5_9EURY|nr:hypothetical protein [Archaeoglobus sulfaticallidus]AGK61585.1 hypothetical protein Asulf_01609 [Archaeoglobus sulfaticallidus PM70-1]